MHCYQGKSATFYYNSDYSGSFLIEVKTSDGKTVKVEISGEDMVNFSKQIVASQLISVIEQWM